MKIQSFSFAILAAVAALTLPALAAGTQPPSEATPPPSPPPVAAGVVPGAPAAQTSSTPAPTTAPSASPMPSEQPVEKGKHGRAAAVRAVATPIPRTGIEGVWEVQIQRGDQVTYAHFQLKQLSDDLLGVYLAPDNKKYPIAGSLDGKQLRLVVSKPDGTTLLFEATVDGTTDMLGLLTDAKGPVPFTAAYRPKENWMDNLNTQPGGLGNPTGVGATGGTGGSAAGTAAGIPPE